MPLSPSITTRRWLPRRLGLFRPGLFWPLTLVLALTAALVTAGVVQQAWANSAAFGSTRQAPVAAHDLAIGAAITEGDLQWHELPVVAVPPGTFDGDPVGRVVTSPIVEGEVVVTARLGPDGVSGPLALVPSGRRALVVPIDALVPSFQVGAAVDVLAAGRWVARHGVLIETTETAVTVAVDENDAPEVSVAVLEGTAALALVGTG